MITDSNTNNPMMVDKAKRNSPALTAVDLLLNSCRSIKVKCLELAIGIFCFIVMSGLTAPMTWANSDASNVSEREGVMTQFDPGTISIPGSICSGATITISSVGMGATGGSGTIQYEWETSGNGTSWSVYSQPGADQASLTNVSTTNPSLRWYRRRAWSSLNESNQYSNAVNLDNITVAPALDPGSLFPQDVCYNAYPAVISGGVPSGGGGGYTYTWQVSNNGSSWSAAVTGGASFNYQTEFPASTPLTSDLYVRRNVTSSCGNNSYAQVVLNSLPLYTAGTLSANPSELADGGGNVTLSTSGVVGGSVTYQKCTTGCSTTNDTGWTNLAGSSANIIQTTKFRAKLNQTNCGVKYSTTAEVEVYPAFMVGTISIPSTTCNGTPITISSAMDASGGKGTPQYQWEYYTGSTWTDYVVAGSDQASLSNVSITNPTFRRFRRRAWSDFNENLYSNEVDLDNITVLAALDPGSLFAQDVCHNAFPSLISGSNPTGGGGGYTYTWQVSGDGSSWSTAVSGGAAFDYENEFPQATALVADLYVRRNVTSACGETGATQVLLTSLQAYTAGSIGTDISETAYGGNVTLSNSGAVGGGVIFQACPTGCSTTDDAGWSTVSTTVYNLTATTKFRAKLDNENCGAFYTSTDEVIVHPKFQPGAVGRTLATTVTLFSDLDAWGGKGAISYQWEYFNGTAWVNYPGTANQSELSNLPAADPAYRKFRRKAWSELNETQQYSNEVDLDRPDEIYSYVREINVVKEGITQGVNVSQTDPDSLRETGTYYDGLGRKNLTLQKQASPSGFDLLGYTSYDDFGRQTKVHLPYSGHLTVSKDGNFDPQADQAQRAFYDDHFTAGASNYAFTETEYEGSPLNRLVKTYAPGQPWARALGNRPVSSEYASNIANEVIHWEVENGMLKKVMAYEPGTLYKTIITDENGKRVQEFKNLRGQIILKKVQLSETEPTDDEDWLQTYYVFDDFGNLRFVLPPMGTKHYLTEGQNVPDGTPLVTADANFEDVAGPDQKVAFLPPAVITVNKGTTLYKGAEIYRLTAATENFVLNQTFVDQWTFQYRYDARQRMIEKKVPGASWVYMVYDDRDRLVMTQDGNQRAQNEWLFTKYDRLNRLILTGIYDAQSAVSLDSMQNYVNQKVGTDYAWFEQYSGNTSFEGYDGQSFPNSNIKELLTVTYYDNYAFTTDAHWTLGDYSTQSQAKTLVTGSKVKVPGHGWNESIILYDSRYRVEATVTKDYMNNKDSLVNEYYSLVHPRIEKTVQYHESALTGTADTIAMDYSYDHADRILSLAHQINSETAVVILENEYNELGELITKKLNKEGTNQYSQEIDYQYNIRGWLTKINDPVTPNANDYFNMQLKYDEAGQYNGNIGATSWKNPFETATNSYAYSYDAVNRIKSAGYSTTATGGMDFDLNNVTYDANGNILTLQRTGNHADQVAQLFDDLDYDYVGNQLTKVTDASGKDTGFKDGANTTNEYLYDANGNMISDANKGIDSIAYNHLNLPIRVEMNADGSNRIEYIYDAAGIKMAQLVYGADTLTKRTDYQGAFIYEDSVLQFIQHEEGRIVIAIPPGAGEAIFDYQYHLKDHLGNVRATFKTSIDTDTYEATLETENDATESQYFQNLTTRATHGSANKTTNGNEAAALSNSAMVGPAISLKVLPGDTIDMEVWAYYEGGGGYNSQVTLASFISSLAATFGGASGAGGESGAIFDGIDDAVTAGAGGIGGSGNDAVPAAYLSYILFDDNYNEIQNGYQEISSSASFAHEKLFLNDIDINQAGYLYIYTSMQSDVTSPVYFDDLKVTHTHSPIVSKDDYYPFGLTFNGYSRPAGTAQNFKYNGKEEQNDLDFNVLDYGSRMYMPELGRFFTQDRFSEKYYSINPYQYAANDPISMVDINGDSIWFSFQYNDQNELSGVTMNVTGKVMNASSDDIDMDNAVSDIVEEVSKAFNGTFEENGKDVTFNTNIELSEASSMDDVSESDHLFVIANNNGTTANGAANMVGGKVAYLNSADFSNNGSIAGFFGWSNTRSSAHEFGHLAGLMHHEASGFFPLMTSGGSGSNVSSSNLKSIVARRDNLNRGSNSSRSPITGKKYPNTTLIDPSTGKAGHINQIGIHLKLKKTE